MNYTHYRASTLGTALTDSLDELIRDHELTPQLAFKVMQIFDRSIAETLMRTVRTKSTFKGRLITYRYVDEVWRFVLGETQFRFDGGEVVHADRVKIVACVFRRDGAP